jgi:hypothetical protein
MDSNEASTNPAHRTGKAARTGRTCFAFGLIVSLLLHGFLGVQTVRSKQEVQQSEDRLVLELVRKVRWIEKERRRQAAPSQGVSSPASSLPALQPRQRQAPSKVFFGRSELEDRLLPEPVRGSRVRKVLRMIQGRVDPLWRKAHPPGLGTVELRVKLSPEGKVVSLWITKLHGDSELADFIAGLLKKAAPYARAMEEFAKPLVVDCRFEINSSDRG